MGFLIQSVEGVSVQRHASLVAPESIRLLVCVQGALMDQVSNVGRRMPFTGDFLHQFRLPLLPPIHMAGLLSVLLAVIMFIIGVLIANRCKSLLRLRLILFRCCDLLEMGASRI